MTMTLYVDDGRELPLGPTFNVLSFFRHVGQIDPVGWPSLAQVPHLEDEITIEDLDGIANDALSLLNDHEGELAEPEVAILESIVQFADGEDPALDLPTPEEKIFQERAEAEDGA